MKLTARFKWILFATLIALYITGVLTWFLEHWLLRDSGFGPEPSPLRTYWMQLHSIVGLWFLAVFGYLFSVHIGPAWRRRKKLLSGVFLTAVLIILCATVPGLFYLSNEYVKANVAAVHTYVGLAAIGVFLLHYFSKRT